MIDTEAHWIHIATTAVEVVGTAIIVVGAFGSLSMFLFQLGRRSAPRAQLVSEFRSSLGRSILLGLEFLVAADIINTVAIEPTVQSLLILAGIVLIRTFLSFSLEVEIDGRWPWQKSSAESRNGAATAGDNPTADLPASVPARSTHSNDQSVSGGE